MPDLTLMRIRTDKEKGTFGNLYIDTKFFCNTIEPPDFNDDGIDDNEKGRSCIPAGDYLCKRDYYHRGKYETFEITGVPNRSEIKFHTGNDVRHTAGCILIGLEASWNPFYVSHSKITFNEFMEALEGVDEFTLSILWAGEPVA